ncbi:MAG: alpha/beta fold hydrolase [Nannocystaceae bacterium]|nr:alpha/beta fold hydrolase [bacterium]
MSIPPDAREVSTLKRFRWAAGLLGLTMTLGCSFVDQAARAKSRKFERVGVTSHVANLGPDQIRYWEGGRPDGETVLLLHGFGADALWQWHPQIRALAKQYRVVAPDLLWFGESSSDDPTYSIEHQARAVLALLDHEDVDTVHLVGVSYGGMVAHEVMGQAPGRVERVILVASPARAFLVADKEEVLAEYGAASVEDLLLPQTPAELRRLMSLAYQKPPRVPKFVAQGVLDRYYRPHRPNHLELLRAVEDNTKVHRTRFQAPPHPTLIIWGEYDRVFPKKAAFRIHEELGGRSTLCVFDDAAHAPHLERADDVIPMMQRFLRGDALECDPKELR